jgi:hypothetical protein
MAQPTEEEEQEMNNRGCLPAVPTAAMLDAGVAELLGYELDYESPLAVVMRIYTAMAEECRSG